MLKYYKCFFHFLNILGQRIMIFIYSCYDPVYYLRICFDFLITNRDISMISPVVINRGDSSVDIWDDCFLFFPDIGEFADTIECSEERVSQFEREVHEPRRLHTENTDTNLTTSSLSPLVQIHVYIDPVFPTPNCFCDCWCACDGHEVMYLIDIIFNLKTDTYHVDHGENISFLKK